MSEYPRLRHNYKCQDPKCPYCFEDAEKLNKFLKKEIKAGNLDYLGRYRWWLDNVKKFPEAETEFGWFNPAIFSPELIDEFIVYSKNRYKGKKYKSEWEVKE